MLKRQVWSVFSLALALSTLVLTRQDAAASVGVTTRVSVANDGTQGDGWSHFPATSADGRFVAFYSEASNLVAADSALCDMNFDGVPAENCGDVFIRDLQAGVTELLSVDSEEVQANRVSARPSVSEDGRFVTFLSVASNLVNGDTNNETDVFIRDRALGTTERVSVDTNEEQGTRHGEATVNADGRFAAFESCGLSPPTGTGICAIGGSSALSHVYVRDRQMGTTTRVSVDSSGIDGNGDSFDPDISEDGRFIAFYSRASNLVQGDTGTCAEFPSAGQCEDVFVHDRVTGTTERVSVADSGAQGDHPSRHPSISGDGRFVAFESWATNLVPDDTNGMSDVFVKDRLSGTLSRLAHNGAGVEYDGPSGDVSLSGTGRYLGFMSGATNVVPDDTNFCGSDVPPSCLDVFVQDTWRQLTVRVSVSSDGTQSPADSFSPSVSGDGGRVSFASFAPNLVADDTNGYGDLFTHALADLDGDGEWDAFDACPSNPDCDGDEFLDGAEVIIGTNPLAACGVDAWPPDINNDGFVDVIGDIIPVANHFGEAVPQAPARYDIVPDGVIDVIGDLTRMAGLFGQSCAPVSEPVNQQVNDLVYDPVSDRIYISVPSGGGSYANSIVPFNPYTREFGIPIPIGLNPNKLALSPDGRYLYVGVDGETLVRRLHLPSGVADLTFTLGEPSANSHCLNSTMGDGEVFPTSPESIAISRVCPGLSPPFNGVAVFDSGVKRPVEPLDGYHRDSIALSDDATNLFGYEAHSTGAYLTRHNVWEFGISGAGIKQDGIDDFNFGIKWDAGVLYGSDGRVVEPTTLDTIARYDLTRRDCYVYGRVDPDSTNNRTYFVTHDGCLNLYEFQAFDLQTRDLLAVEAIPGAIGFATDIVQWGADGIAFATDSGQLILVQSPFIVGPARSDEDGDGIFDTTEGMCGSDRFNPASVPERIDTPGDDDSDGLVNESLPAGSEAYDCDGDGFIGSTEQYVFSAADTAHDQACANAWPPDMNNNGVVDLIGDIVSVANWAFQPVPTAPRRYDIAPDPPDGVVDVIGDLVRMANLFGQSCA